MLVATPEPFAFVEVNRAGTSVLLIEQNARCALDVCHRAYVFEIGKIAFTGPRNELVNDERIKKAYFGGSQKSEL